MPDRRRHPSGRRGFALLTVLMLVVIASIVIGAALQRASLQNLIVEQQIDGYQRHHELQGVRAMVDAWLAKGESISKLTEFANTGETVDRIALESGVTYRVYAQDGQGTLLTNLSGIVGDVPRRWIISTLSRMPPDRPDLTRDAGPWRISLPAAPDEVLQAMSGDDPTIFSALKVARDEQVATVSEFLSTVQSRGVEDLTATTLSRYIVYSPDLWRFDIEAIHPDRTERYVVFAYVKGNNRKILAWRELRHEGEVRGFGPGAGRWPHESVPDRTRSGRKAVAGR